MNDNVRWAIVIVAAALVIGLLAYGRGTAAPPRHRRRRAPVRIPSAHPLNAHG